MRNAYFCNSYGALTYNYTIPGSRTYSLCEKNYTATGPHDTPELLENKTINELKENLNSERTCPKLNVESRKSGGGT